MKKRDLLLKIMLLSILPGFTSNSYAQSCPSGMISFWKFDDVSTELFIDSYDSHDAESETAVATTTGKVLSAKYLSGTNVITVDDHNDFDFPANSSFTVECWINFSDPSFNPSPTPQIVIGKRDSELTGAYWFIGIENPASPTGKVTFELQAEGDTYKEIKSTSDLSGAWHHIVAVRDESTNTNKLYVDGNTIPDASEVYDYTGSFSNDGSIMIGAYPDDLGIPSYFYQGNIDEVAIYDRALTPTEIHNHFIKGDNGINYCEGYNPSFKSTPVNTAVVGQQYKYPLYATGMPTILYSLVTGPAGMTIVNDTVNWTPTTTDVNAWVEIRANNSYAPADTQKYRIYLAEEPVCPSDLSVLLKLNETSGTTYYDFYGAHDATVADTAPVPTTGIVYGAQYFDGTSKVDIPDNGEEFEWFYTDDFSIEFWMKTTTTANMVIIGRHRKDGDYPDLARWWVGTDPSGVATFYLRDNNETPKWFEISGGAALSDNIWHHIIAVRDGSSQQNRLYVDGVRVNDVTTNYENGFRADIPTEISIGYWKRAYSYQEKFRYTGAVDEVAIFDKAITDGEAAEYFNSRNPNGHCAIDNYVPVITSVPVTSATEDVEYSYTFTVEDIDVTDLITLSAPTKPSWLNFNYTAGQKTATLTETPGDDEAGNDYDVILQVYDGTATKQQSFTISVTNVNDPPEITSTPVTTGYVGDLYVYVFTAEDVDDETLDLSAVELPASGWLTFNPSNGVLSGTPEQSDKGDNLVILRVSDGEEDVDQEFIIDVDGPTGLDELEAAGINLYPIPADDYLTIEFDNVTDEMNLEIIDADGSIIKKDIVPVGQQRYDIDLSELESGVYYLHMINNNVNSIGRFVILK